MNRSNDKQLPTEESPRSGMRFVDSSDLSEAERLIKSGELSRQQPDRTRTQFTLAGLMVFVSLICLGLARVEWMPASIYAGVLGFLALAGCVIVSFFRPRSSLYLAFWIGVIFAYLAACIAAVLRLAG
jgi:hypothetical protein